ncbi:zinc finger protein 43 [Pectinophora gossypiella]|uniref:zinc finger protein 43 n=1 Tax=Pectinophora gossypiella TaxID=13191 RepID=UPI00214E540F|nr:zinc finger protein 43 [Pectinophora gossypiella]
MLSPREDDDDDSHLCIKCNSTIVGLDNYIKHRKERCGKKIETAKPDLPPIDPLEPTYSLGADVFFQSLELQSSVKKTSLARITPPIPIPKANLDRKSALAIASTSRDTPRMSPLETNLRGEDWIGGHSLRIGVNEDNQTKLINAVASISGAVKKEIPTSSYSMGYNDYKGDEDSEESEESEDDDDEEIHPTGGKWKPPPNYTGGKWRPASPDHEDYFIRDIQEHTGGKWKPFLADTNDRDEDYDAPPPGHTKGKWVPGAHEKTQIMQTTIQSKGSVQYWCGPCNRRLGSRAIYEKHLMSNLHMRKVLPEHELEFSGHLQPVRKTAEKRTTRPSRFVDESLYTQSKKMKRDAQLDSNVNKQVKKKRKRKPLFVHCSGCRSRVRLHLMGKHLISHYHFRKTTETESSSYKQLILSNITAIVHQSPFQCSPCKFYTNWLSNFMQHCYSEEHEQKITSIDGRYWCSFCKFECETSNEMLQHLSGSEHSEVIAVINRSMPIIIRKKSIIRCETCHQEFRYNIEVKRHCVKTGHKMCYTATDDHQEFHKCGYCSTKFKSSLTLAAHLKSKHKKQAFLCLVCSRSFTSSEEAKRHRQTSEHRIKRKENMREKGIITKELMKKCPYCPVKTILNNVLELKDHISKVHPEKKRKCPNCGMAFILPQEVSRHVRAKACQFTRTPLNASILWNCSQCLFSTDSQAECFFHEVLHSSPQNEIRRTGEKEKAVQKYTCPLCPKSFTKASLRRHLRQHTFERPHICRVCGANFTRQSSLDNHMRNEHGPGVAKLPKIAEEIELREEFVCSKCKKSFSNKSALSRHDPNCRVDEERQCSHEHCAYIAATPMQLIKHRRAHGEKIKHHECLYCPFQTDQASHMKRHMVCHEGIKPYACPHCQFTCASLENLRKHVLRSGRHLGLFLYKCYSCEYQTNLATDLRFHLTDTHSDKYDAKTAIQSVKTHLMIPEFRTAQEVKTETIRE